MSYQEQHGQQPAQQNSDGWADSISAIVIIALVVGAVVFWLSSMHH
jgi:hypothetical protein